MATKIVLSQFVCLLKAIMPAWWISAWLVRLVCSVVKMYSLSLSKQFNKMEIDSSPEISLTRVSDKNITVRFELNEFDTVAQVYPELTTIGDVLDDVASKFQMPPKYLSIKQKFGSKPIKTSRLHQLCTNNFRILDVKLGLSDLAIQINESIHNEHEKILLDTNFYYRYAILRTASYLVSKYFLVRLQPKSAARFYLSHTLG